MRAHTIEEKRREEQDYLRHLAHGMGYFLQFLEALAKQRNNSKKAAESTLKIFIDEEAFDNSYGYVSHPIEVAEDKQIAVRIVTHFGEEVTKVLTID